MSKTLNNTTARKAVSQVSDIEFWGDGDQWKLIGKASSKKEGWMKSTKAMSVGLGCLVQVTTQQGDNVAEAVTFIPGVKIVENIKDSVCVGRSIQPLNAIDQEVLLKSLGVV